MGYPSISQWYKSKIYLDSIAKETLEPHHFYRALDYLYQIKESLEISLYNQLVNLFNLDLSIVFYDLTSTYFEGTECEIAEFGYSRDSRPDTRQIVLGLVVTRTGIPIAHEVFNGNTADKSTVQNAVVENKLGNQTLMCTTRLEKEQKEILNVFGIKNIPRVLSAN